MKRVLITGITGFVGSHMAEYCLSQEVKLYGFKRYHLTNLKNVLHIEDKINWFDCDMMEGKSVMKCLKEIRPDIIFHMASQSFVSPSWNHPLLYMNANYAMTVHLLEGCLDAGIDPLIHIPGSGEEHGEILDCELPISEQTILRPVNPYAVSKIAQDLIAYVYFRSYGTRVIRTRAFNHEGPRRDKVFGIPWYAYQIARIEQGKQEPHMEVGHLDDRRNFTHVKDMVRAYWQAVHFCNPGELYLIGNTAEDSIFSFREALEMLIAMSTVKGISYEVVPKYVRPTQVPSLICDTTKFTSLSGWRPEIGFTTILIDTLDYWRERLRKGDVN
jgi:GDP-4-dehydro-6-deoxy-D-mannose reductase